jgi:GAF domain-containing protein
MVTTTQPLTARDRAAALRGKAAQTAQEELDALLEVVKAIHSTLDVAQLLDLVVARAIALTGADRGCLIVAHDLGQCVEVARDRNGALPPEAFRPSRTIVERVVERKSALVLADVAGSEFGGQQSVVDLGIRMALCAPMLAGDDLFGLLYVDGAAGQEGFSESRLRTLDALAGQAVIAWQQARTVAEIRGLYEKLRILDAAKMDFIDVASHELRTPLSIIRGYTEHFGRRDAPGRDRRHDAERLADRPGPIPGPPRGVFGAIHPARRGRGLAVGRG